MLRLLACLTVGLVVADPGTVINFNFEGLLSGLYGSPNPPTPPTPAPEPTYLPIPAHSKGPAPLGQSPYDYSWYYYESVGQGVYWATNTIYNSMFIVTANGVWVFDVPGAWVYDCIKAVTDKNITHVVYTHTHVDHVGATGPFLARAAADGRKAPTVVVIASQESLQHLTKQADPNRPLPSVTLAIDENRWFTVGSLNVSIHALPYEGHLRGSLVIWVPAVATIMCVDVAFPGWAPFYRMGMAADLDSLDDVYNLVLSYDFTTFVGGHLARAGTYAEVQQQQEYLASLREFAAVGNAQATSEVLTDVFTRGGDNAWLAMQYLFEIVNKKCSTLLIERWANILAAVDVTGPDHCWMMTEHLRID